MLSPTRRKAFIRKWRLKCRAVADSLEEAGDKLFTFTRFPPSQWKSIRTSNAIERLHEEFKRRIKTQTVLPSAETAAMLFWHVQGRRMADPRPEAKRLRSLPPRPPTKPPERKLPPPRKRTQVRSRSRLSVPASTWISTSSSEVRITCPLRRRPL